LIELYQLHSSLWDMNIADYKNIAIKKKAKEEIETHFGLLGDLQLYASLRYMYEKCKISIKTSLLKTAGSRPATRPHPGQAPGSLKEQAKETIFLPCHFFRVRTVKPWGVGGKKGRLTAVRWRRRRLIERG